MNYLLTIPTSISRSLLIFHSQYHFSSSMALRGKKSPRSKYVEQETKRYRESSEIVSVGAEPRSEFRSLGSGLSTFLSMECILLLMGEDDLTKTRLQLQKMGQSNICGTLIKPGFWSQSFSQGHSPLSLYFLLLK